ncbi:hypothetical protein [Streptomyces albus]|uniref:hypothetical protein n=1 Tax=Streptomyces albus TaxID=1888 RepID=UPI00131C6BA4|nr:hypothetical protein [Streptomyces albus]
MLREQAVAEKVITVFTALDYPSHRAAVVAITTEREDTARKSLRTRLPYLADTFPLVPDRLRGLFPGPRQGAVAAAVNTVQPEDRLAVLTELFDAEPTTAQVVAGLTGTRPSQALRLVHLHQPDTGGRKAGQLNFAVDHLNEVLGPLGWREEQDGGDTFVLVYDADAIADVRALRAFAKAALAHRRRTGGFPALAQEQRLPLLLRHPFRDGPAGLLLAGEWMYQVRRSLGIELSRVRLHEYLTTSRLPGPLRALLRPMVYGVGCGMGVHLPALRTLGGFPEPMEDLGTGHRLTLLGKGITAVDTAVLDEPYTDLRGVTNLHALAFTASARPDRHARAVAHLPGSLSRTARGALVLREWADEAAWLFGAPITAAAVLSSWWSGPVWAAVSAVGVALHGPVLTARLMSLVPRLHAAARPPGGAVPTSPRLTPLRWAALIATSPVQPFVRLVGPWQLICRRLTGRRTTFGKTER